MRKSQDKFPQKTPQSTTKGKNAPAPVPAQKEIKPFNILDYTKDGLTKDQVMEFKTAFDIFDHNGSGQVQISDVKQAFMNLGFHHQSSFAQTILNHLEKVNGGIIDFAQFIRLATGKLHEEYTLPQTTVVFSAYDPKTSGKFSIYDLKDTIRSIGQDMTEDEIQKIFRAADVDGDGYVTNEDFHTIITKVSPK